MTTAPDVNNYLDQIRSRIEAAEKKLLRAVDALKSDHAAKGRLRSGATIKRTLDLVTTEFDQLTDTVLIYLGKTLERTGLERSELLSLTSAALLQSLIAFKSMANPTLLRSFAPSKSIDQVIDDAFAQMDRQLTLRLQEFAFGLSDHAPNGRKAEASPVVNNIKIGTNLGNVQQGNVNSSQTMSVTLSASAINTALDQFERALGDFPEAERALMAPDVIALRAQASKTTLAEGAIKEIGKSLRGVSEGIAGNLATPAFLVACNALWLALGIG